MRTLRTWMRRRLRSGVPAWWLWLPMVVAWGACDESPTTPTRDDVMGRWQVVRLEPSGGPAISPQGVVLAVEFDGDRLSAQGDCNVCSGRYVLEERRLMLTPLACTRRACPQGSLDDPFFRLLEGELTATLNGALLVVDGRSGRIVLRR